MLNDNGLISIIVPVFNVEKYLRRCINSIIKQTYKNLEIIIIDDGSTDGSPVICDDFREKDSRIKVIHQSNGGLSKARNKGIELASGDFIAFVDADDYIAPTMYEELKNNMDEFNSDISICQYYKCFRFFKQTAKGSNNTGVYKFKKKFDNLYNDNKVISYYAWNKLYKKEMFNSISYPVGLIFEDIYIICDLFESANSISYINKPLYYYTMRRNGISRTYTVNHYNEINAIDKNIKFYKKKSLF